MSDKPVTMREARLEIFLTQCALEPLKARYKSPDAEDQGLFVEPIVENTTVVEAELIEKPVTKGIGAYPCKLYQKPLTADGRGTSSIGLPR